MNLLLDTGVIIALLDRRERRHEQCVRLCRDSPAQLVTCEAAVVEACHLLRHIHGAPQAVVANVEAGIFRIPCRLADRGSAVRELMKKYADVPMSLADACLVDLATQLGTGRILTLDSDFRVYRWGRNRPFEMLIELD